MPRGRPKGAKGKMTFNAQELAQKMGIDPLEVLLMITAGDWEGLGFSGPSKISYTNAGIEFEEPNIPLQVRQKAASDAAKYLYSTRSAVSLSTEGEGFKVILEDYTGKK